MPKYLFILVLYKAGGIGLLGQGVDARLTGGIGRLGQGVDDRLTGGIGRLGQGVDGELEAVFSLRQLVTLIPATQS